MITSSFCCVFFFFKQKTAYEMRISDWSSDVCSSDLCNASRNVVQAGWRNGCAVLRTADWSTGQGRPRQSRQPRLRPRRPRDPKSVVEGKGGSVSVGIGGRRLHKKTKDNRNCEEQHSDSKRKRIYNNIRKYYHT